MATFEDEVQKKDEAILSKQAEAELKQILGADDPQAPNRCRRWVFTWNNYPALKDEDFLGGFRLYFGDNLRYIAWSREIAPKTKTPHLQGFAYFHEAVVKGKALLKGGYSKGSLKGFCSQVWWQQMYSNYGSCLGYCSKWGKQPVFTFGEPPAEEGPGGGLGERNDLKTLARKVITETISREAMYIEHPDVMVRCSRGFEGLFNFIQPHRTGRPHVIWMYGPSGSGKSEFPERIHGREKVYRKIDGGLFFNGYTGQEVCVIEEFTLRSTQTPEGWTLTKLLQLLDKYEISVDVKGSSVKFNSPYVYITSVPHPSFIITDGCDFIQVLRRLDAICTVGNDGQVIVDEEHAKFYFDETRVAPDLKVPDKLLGSLARRQAKHEQDLQERRKRNLMLVAKYELMEHKRGVVIPAEGDSSLSPLLEVFDDEMPPLVEQ